MPGNIENFRDAIFWWSASLFSSTMIVMARLGFILFGSGELPPGEPALEERWARKRRWIAISEVSALPAFATTSVALVSWYQVNPVITVLIAMAQGFIGFPLLLDGAAWLFRRRLGMQPANVETHDA